MRLPSYTRSDRALRSHMAARRLPRVVRFCVVFFGLFAGACFFWGGDMLAYAQEGSFLMLGLTLLVCGIVAAATISKSMQKLEYEFDEENPLPPPGGWTNPDFRYSPSSPLYVDDAGQQK